jgi:zinc protease
MRKNKWFIISSISFFILIFALISWAEGEPKVSEGSKIIEKFQYPPLVWKVPEVGKEVERLVLDNGMILYLKEDHTLPLVNIDAIVRTGSIYEPKEKYGTASLAGTLLRSGGTTARTPDQLNQELEFLAASVETYVGTESGGANLNVLSKDLDKSLEIFADVLMHPAFSPEQLDLEKGKIKERIRRKNDNPNAIVNREFRKVIAGEHPFAWELNWNVVKNIGRDDLVAFHQKYYHPNNIMLGITGDFKRDEMIEKIKNAFAGWEKKEISFPPIPELKKEYHPGVFFVEKELTQSNILMGELGVKRDNPDNYAIAVMNYILGGGGFVSRLTSKVRSDEGLAYSVHSNFDTDSRDWGTFSAGTQTKTKSTHFAIGLFLDEFKRIRAEKVPETELKAAKDAFINRYVFSFTSPNQIVSQLMSLEYDHRPLDYYQTYLDKIRAVTADDILRVAKKYLKPEELTIFVVGKSADLDKPLGDLGKVTPIKLEEQKLD